jgi:hypothetical protein
MAERRRHRLGALRIDELRLRPGDRFTEALLWIRTRALAS